MPSTGKAEEVTTSAFVVTDVLAIKTLFQSALLAETVIKGSIRSITI